MSSLANPGVFREYDIRGVADRDLTDPFVTGLGQAIATTLAGVGARRVTLGRDCRLSSPRIQATLAKALLAAGLDVVDIGLVHTPALYFSVFHLAADGGVMVTASHNPASHNGFKIVVGRSTIFGADIQRLRTIIEAGTFAPPQSPGVASARDVLPDYVATIAANITLGPRRFKVVVDGGNGTGGIAALPVLARLGVEHEELYCEPDGRFPHHHPDPTQPDNLRELIMRVRATGAELGIALDGDGDRIGVVDGRGRIIWGDQLVLLFAREILARRPGATFVGEVKCSEALFDGIRRLGGRAVMGKAGHSVMKAKMVEEGAALAGEMSGHMFFADRWFGFDDAVYASARLIELLTHTPASLAELYDELPVLHNTPELRVDCADDLKFEIVARVVAHYRGRHPVVDIDGARIAFPGGWGLVRASNTGPELVLRFEAETPSRLAELRREVDEVLARATAALAAQRSG